MLYNALFRGEQGTYPVELRVLIAPGSSPLPGCNSGSCISLWGVRESQSHPELLSDANSCYSEPAKILQSLLAPRIYDEGRVVPSDILSITFPPISLYTIMHSVVAEISK